MSLPARRSDTPKEIAVVEKRSLAETAKERAFLDYVERMQEGIDYARRSVGTDAADDIVQSILLSMWKRWDSFTPEQRLLPYFMKAVSNRILKLQHREDRLVELTEEIESSPDFPTVVVVSQETQREDQLRWIREMIKRMPPRRREVFLLVRELEFTYEEAAKTLGISVKTVDAQIQKAREYFAQGLEHGGVRLTRETMRKMLLPPPKLLPPPRTEGPNHE